MTIEFTLGDRIRKARVLAGLTQAELADAVGVTQAALSRWEHAESEPRASQLIALAAATGFGIAEILGLGGDD